jgi:hypothetical protein
MKSMNPIDGREAGILKLSQSETDVALLQQHLKEIVEGTAFKGSHRSGQFLSYIVEQAITGNFESLKERAIGVELFGRSPSYDTGEDAIVRVTASDVRKRLLQHYGQYGSASGFRISLPLGSYIPEIAHEHSEESVGSGAKATPEPGGSPQPTPNPSAAPSSSESPAAQDALIATGIPESDVGHRGRVHRLWLVLGTLVLVLNLGLWSLFWFRPAPGSAPASQLPWSLIFNSAHPTHLITSDPTIVNVQELTGSQLSVSDYANHQFIPQPNHLTPDEIRFSRILLGGDSSSAASVDTPIAVGIAYLARTSASRLDVHGARSIRFADLKNDDNFIFLGSPRSDPWVSLFNDQLDFQFSFDPASKQEFIRNVHPRQNELPAYYPTAPGWATGQSFGIVALVQNPDQEGHVLVLAGATGEGTEAAGKLVTDLPRLSPILKSCGLDPTGRPARFELLLRFNAMAGSANNIDVVACHILKSH